MNRIDSNYSNYYVTETGPPVDVLHTAENYLPHSYYVSMVISELSSSNNHENILFLDDMIERLDFLISFIHEDLDVKQTVVEYFSDRNNLIEVLTTMADTGLLHIEGDTISVSQSQLDYIRDFLLEYHYIT